MKLFPTVIALVLCSCLLCNVQQSYAKSAPGEKKRKLSVRLYFLLVAYFIVVYNSCDTMVSDQFPNVDKRERELSLIHI